LTTYYSKSPCKMSYTPVLYGLNFVHATVFCLSRYKVSDLFLSIKEKRKKKV